MDDMLAKATDPAALTRADVPRGARSGERSVADARARGADRSHLPVMSSVWFGRGVADDSEYRLCGDVNGKRVLELGIAPTPAQVAPNSVTLAALGAKAIALDARTDRITTLRQRAEEAEVHVECHVGELADLGFVTSASIDLAVAAQTLDEIDDLPRLLRQVHRVLRPESPFVVSLTHPLAAMFDSGQTTPVRRYGSTARSISELFMSFERSNFRLDVLHELVPINGRDIVGPTVLLIRARKQGV
jgi:SAM-dependent methyltransferase